MAGHYTLSGEFRLLTETIGTIYNSGISNIELSSDAVKNHGVLMLSGERQSYKGTIYVRSLDEDGEINVQDFIERLGGGDGGGGVPYTLPTMNTTLKGGAMVGTGLAMSGDSIGIADSYIPSAYVTRISDGARITITDHNGTTKADVDDGAMPTITSSSITGGVKWVITSGSGTDSVEIYNGKSPTVTSESITGGNKLKIKDSLGYTTINIMNGTSASISSSSITGGYRIVLSDAEGNDTINLMNGTAPTVTSESISGGHNLIIHDAVGYTTIPVLDGVSPTISSSTITGGNRITIKDADSTDTVDIMNGSAPTITTASISGGNKLTIKDAVGYTTISIMDGASASIAADSISGGHRVTLSDADGSDTIDVKDGVSPTITSESISGGHNIIIHDTTGYTTVAVMDGVATGAADVSLSNLAQAGEDHYLNSDFTIIYPNGGTAASPATIAANSRYVESNPFPGYYVACTIEALYNSQWGPIPFPEITAGGTLAGTACGQLNDDSIIIQTAQTLPLCVNGSSYGDLFGRTGSSVEVPTPMVRVKVRKIGKIPA